ncbi:MAG: hypothetical protein QXK88_06940 [Desulfurococcaceae archaeon]
MHKRLSVGSLASFARRAAPLLVISLGLASRAAIAPYTAESDIPQFADFADTFLRHGLCFYRYSTSHRLEEWPYPWPYPYGSLLVLILAPLRLVARREAKCYWESGSCNIYTPMEWVVLTKTVFMLFDTLAAVFIYALLSKRSRGRALLALAFYYLNPATIYVSSIYGMFDSIPLSLLLLSMIQLSKSPRKLGSLGALVAGFLITLAATTKMNTLYPALFVALWAISTRDLLIGPLNWLDNGPGVVLPRF